MSISAAYGIIFLSAGALFFATFYFGDPYALCFASISIHITVLVTHRSVNTWASAIGWHTCWTTPPLVNGPFIWITRLTWNIWA